MRLLLITKTHLVVYEGRKQLAVFEAQPLTREWVEELRTQKDFS